DGVGHPLMQATLSGFPLVQLEHHPLQHLISAQLLPSVQLSQQRNQLQPDYFICLGQRRDT
ncbi:hypothetical protein A2U01_0089348, partial [Trifolium medium]|nr:hypothetical protein [Trifolium medium]